MKTFAAQRNLIAIGQGIVAPTITHNLTYSNGFTAENPSGLANLGSFKLSAMLDTQQESTTLNGYGAELGMGNGRAGLALGFYQRDCSGCEERLSGGFGIALGNSVSFGVSASEDVYTAGFLLNPRGQIRLGATATVFEVANMEFLSLGAGIGYFANSWSLSVEASKRKTDGNPSTDDTVWVTPSLALHVDSINFSVNMDTYVNTPNNSQIDDNIWFGVGIGNGSPYNLSVYHDFQGEWTLVGSLFF